jgi:hypothetical protein
LAIYIIMLFPENLIPLPVFVGICVI